MTSLNGRISSKGLSYIIAGILILVCFDAVLTAWLYDIFGQYNGVRLWKELVIAVCLLPVMIITIRNKEVLKQFFENRLMLVVGFFIALQIVVATITYFSGQASQEALGYGLIVNLRFLFFFLLTAFVSNRTDWLRLNWRTIILLPSIVVIVFGLLQFFVLPDSFNLSHEVSNMGGVVSSLWGSGLLGAYLVIITTTLVVLIATRNHIRFWRIVLLVLAMTCLFLTLSKSVWLAGIVSAIAGAGLCVKTKKQAKVVTIASIVILATLITSLFMVKSNYSESTANLNNVQFYGGNLTDIDDTHPANQDNFLTSIFGNGFGLVATESLDNNHKSDLSNDGYFSQVIDSYGWFGLSVFMLILFMLAKSWIRERSALLNRVMIASLFGIVIINITEYGFMDSTLAYLWWGLAGIAYGSQIARTQERRVRQQKAMKNEVAG